jgi:hypothetical protein
MSKKSFLNAANVVLHGAASFAKKLDQKKAGVSSVDAEFLELKTFLERCPKDELRTAAEELYANANCVPPKLGAIYQHFAELCEASYNRRTGR